MSNYKEKRKLKQLSAESGKKDESETIVSPNQTKIEIPETKEPPATKTATAEEFKKQAEELSNHPVIIAAKDKRKLKDGYTYTGFTVNKALQKNFSDLIDKNGRKANVIYAKFMEKYLQDWKSVHTFLDC
jgi:hypothetical protein